MVKTIDETFLAGPSDLEDLSDGAERINSTRVGFQERMALEHYFAPSGTQARHGRHALGSARAFVGITAPSVPTPDGVASVPDYNGRLFVRTLNDAGNIPLPADARPTGYAKGKVYATDDDYPERNAWVDLAYLDTVSDETLHGTKTFADRPKIDETLNDEEYTIDYAGVLAEDAKDVVDKFSVQMLIDQALVGMICAFAENPNDAADLTVQWVYCDGTNYGAEAYAALRAAHPAWVAKGQVPYVVPDLRDKFVRGASAAVPISVSGHVPSDAAAGTTYNDADSQNKAHKHYELVPDHDHGGCTDTIDGAPGVGADNGIDLNHLHDIDGSIGGGGDDHVNVDTQESNSGTGAPTKKVKGFESTAWKHQHFIPAQNDTADGALEFMSSVDVLTTATIATWDDANMTTGGTDARPKSETLEYWMYIGHYVASA